MEEKSVLIIGNFLSDSVGTQGVCESFAKRLSTAGWQIITTSNQASRVLRLLDMMGAVWKNRRQYGCATIDVFSGLAFIWAEATSFALHLLGKPYILILHGGNLPEFAKRWPGRMARLLRSATVVASPSGYLKNQLYAFRPDIRFIPNPVEINQYSFTNRNRPTPNLIWLRSFHFIYNPQLAVQAFGEILRSFPNARMTMIGPDKGDGSLQAVRYLADSLGIDDRIAWIGSVPHEEVSDWLCQSDIFINTSNVDNTPVSVLEAMASGLCVVSSNVGGIPYLLDDGKDALLVPPKNPKAFATAVCRILVEPGLSTLLSENARRKAECFDWPAIYPRWETILSQAMSISR